MAVASRAEPEGGIVEEGFEDGLEEEPKHRLGNTITNHWDAKRTEGTVAFG